MIYYHGQTFSEMGNNPSKGDLTFSEMWTKNHTIDHVEVTIKKGPRFLIKLKTPRKSLAIGLIDTEGVSGRSRGLIGSFVKPNAYFVTKEDADNGIAELSFKEGKVLAERKQYHRNHYCWSIAENEILPFIH